MSWSCKTCGKRSYSDYCVQHKPRKPIKQRGKVAIANAKTTKEFLDLNPPRADGYWTCYLQITPECPRNYLTMEYLVPEHVIPKSGSAKLRHDQSNIKVACSFCNTSKGSKRL